jgi:integrase
MSSMSRPSAEASHAKPAGENSRKNRIRLTKRSVDSLRPETAAVIWYDDTLSGFGVRVMPSGRRFYFARYRSKHGRSRWFTIGEHGKVTVDAARTKAKGIFQTVAIDGVDPSRDREAHRAAPTVSDLLDRYLSDHVEKRNRPRTRASFKGIVERDIRPALGHLKAAAVTHQDMDRFHCARSATPRQANLILAVCSKAFNLAEVWGMRPDGTNPCKKIEHYRENHRERFLSAEELRRLGETLRQAETIGLPWKVGPESTHPVKSEHRRTVYKRVTTAAIELLLFTGCRLSEVLELRWAQVDFDASTIALLETKSDRPQLVTMNAPARQVLRELEAIRASEWVLPSPKNNNSPISKAGIETPWSKIRKAARLDDVRLHDLRHTVGTYAGQTGANAFLVRDLLRHKNLAMTGRYVNRAADPVRTLNDQVGERISAALAGRPAAEIVPMKRGA